MRVEGWEGKLAEYLEAPPPFEWGTNDCALWSARWIRLCNGVDLVTAWEGKYTTEAGAAKLMKQRGLNDPDGVATASLPVKDVRMAARGDLLLYPNGALGICNGLMGHFLAEGGVITFPTLRCEKAWGVG